MMFMIFKIHKILFFRIYKIFECVVIKHKKAIILIDANLFIIYLLANIYVQNNSQNNFDYSFECKVGQ